MRVLQAFPSKMKPSVPFWLIYLCFVVNLPIYYTGRNVYFGQIKGRIYPAEIKTTNQNTKLQTNIMLRLIERSFDSWTNTQHRLNVWCPSCSDAVKGLLTSLKLVNIYKRQVWILNYI